MTKVICTLLAAALLGACGAEQQLEKREDAGEIAFCRILNEIRDGDHPITNDRNELIGHSKYIELLYAAAPDEIADDLASIYEIIAATRDASGTDSLEAFQNLTDTRLAGYEGRVAEYAQRACNISDGDTSWSIDPDLEPISRCPAWPLAGSPLTNNRFPYLLDTSSANYFSTIFLSAPFGRKREGTISVPRGGKITIKGEFPYAKYFAFHPNDMSTNNLTSLMDIDIEPDQGSINPWREAPAEGVGRRFTVHLVVDKQSAEPDTNTVYIGEMKEGGKNYATFLLNRVYGADLPALPPNSAGVMLPAVTITDKNGKQLAHFEECDPYPSGHKHVVDNTKFPAFPVPDHRVASHAGDFENVGNFGLQVDILSNPDVLYLTSYYGRNHGEVFAIRAKKPNTVNPAKNIRPWSKDLDFRMWSVCTYNFWNGEANACTVDNDIATDEKGYYTLVLSEEQNRPDNARPQDGVTWLNTGNYLDGQISYRMLPKRSRFLTQLAADLKSNANSEYLPKTAFCSKAEFENGGFETCLKSGSN